LAGRLALITGASRGLGAAAALAYAREGAHCVLVARTVGGLEEVDDRIKALGGEPPAGLYPELLRCVEPALLDEVLRRVQGNRWVAAKWLGLNRATVRKKLGVYNLTGAHRPPSVQ